MFGAGNEMLPSVTAVPGRGRVRIFRWIPVTARLSEPPMRLNQLAATLAAARLAVPGLAMATNGMLLEG